jgi:hypothetical protein
VLAVESSEDLKDNILPLSPFQFTTAENPEDRTPTFISHLFYLSPAHISLPPFPHIHIQRYPLAASGLESGVMCGVCVCVVCVCVCACVLGWAEEMGTDALEHALVAFLFRLLNVTAKVGAECTGHHVTCPTTPQHHNIVSRSPLQPMCLRIRCLFEKSDSNVAGSPDSLIFAKKEAF